MHDSDKLRRIQAWMQTVITHPTGIADGIEAAAAKEHLDTSLDRVEQVVTRSSKQSSVERLSVYGNAYFARLLGCLEEEFPATRQAVGAEAFAGFVSAYLQKHPSTSYSLGDLHRRFPDFLSESRPPATAESAAPTWVEFVIDLARLESMYCEVFDGPGEEQLPRLTLESLTTIGPEQWMNSRLTTAASLRLLHLRFPVHVYATAVRKGQPTGMLQPADTWLAVHRKEFIVRRRPLSRRQFMLLSALQNESTVAEAIMASLHDGGEAADTIDDEQLAVLSQQLQADFRTWVIEGYFLHVK